MSIEILQGLAIPFLGTTLGAACVFLLRGELDHRIQKAFTGFAAGIMVAASVWSLLIPSMEESSALGSYAVLPAVVGFWVGTLFLLLLDHIIPHLHLNSDEAEGPKSALSKNLKLVLAVTLHNIPEGMAVGVVLAGWLTGGTEVSLGAALALSLGIAIQNFPEGDWRRADDCRGELRRAGAALSARVCGGCDALRRRGGTHPGDERRAPLEYRRHRVLRWVYADDGARYGAWMREFGSLGLHRGVGGERLFRLRRSVE